VKEIVIIALALILVIAFPLWGGELKTGKLKWTGATDLLKVIKDNARNGSHSLLFDTNIDKSPTSRMVAASIGAEMTGILEGWLLDDPAIKPVWITFGSDMRCCIGVQFGNQANYTLRVGGTNNVDTLVPRIEGWVGFRLEFTGSKVKYYLSLDDGTSWEEVGETKEFKTFKSVHLRNNENTGASKMAAYFDDIRVMDSTGKTVLYEGFGNDRDPLGVSSTCKRTSVWGIIKGLQ
jgi:hypothetical protein